MQRLITQRVIMQRVPLAIYNTFLFVISPFLLAKKAIKFGRRGHKHEWDFGRWNAPSPIEGQGRKVVFVALSWGEVGLLDEISRQIECRSADLHIIWAIRDKASAELAQKAFPKRSITTMPFDFAIPAGNWLESVRPDVLVVVEKFWWPNLVWGAKNRGAKVVLVNGRSRGREKSRYRWLTIFQRWVLSAFDLLLFESQSQIDRVADVLPRDAKVIATGNVKFAFAAPPPPAQAPVLEKWVKDRKGDNGAPMPLLVAGSTAPIDDQWAIEAWQKVNSEIPCTLLIAPRRVERAAEIVADLVTAGYKISLRSDATSGAEILVLDTLGELSYLYNYGIAAYVGGSVEGRGHNIIEPLAWGVPVGYGPNRGDFEGAQRAAEEWEVGTRLRSSDELAVFWKKTLLEPQWRQHIAIQAEKMLEAQHGALENTMTALYDCLSA